MEKRKLENKDRIMILTKNTKLKINYTNKMVDLSEEIRNEIKKYWKLYGENFTNGKIFYISDFEYDKEIDSFNLDVCNSSYDHYLYTRRKKEYDENSCINLWAGAVIETSDNKLVLGEMSSSTICQGEYHISGGSTDIADVNENTINYEKTMIRELYEEFGIDINNKKVVKDYILKYIKLPTIEEVELSFGILYKINLNITYSEFEKEYEKYLEYLKKNDLEIEFTKPIAIDKNKNSIKNVEKEYRNKIPKYTIELFLKDL